MKTYSHMFDVAFTLVTTISDYEKVPEEKLLQALKVRVASLELTLQQEGRGSIEEVFGYSDSYEMDPAEQLTD